MNNDFNFIEYVINHFDFAAVFAAIISISASIYIFRTTPKYDLVYKRYFSLLSPLFEMLEPYLFQPVDENILNTALSLIEENTPLAGSKLLQSLYFCKRKPNQENYDTLCLRLSREYDRCCARLGLGKRSVWYKIIRNQYKNKYAFLLYIFANGLLLGIVLMSFIILIAFLVNKIAVVTGIEIFPLTR